LARWSGVWPLDKHCEVFAEVQASAFGVDMCITCKHATYMSKMIQIRNVPTALHRKLKSRAALAGMTLSDYLLKEIGEVAERPTMEELRERLRKRSPVNLSISVAEAVREERERR